MPMMTTSWFSEFIGGLVEPQHDREPEPVVRARYGIADLAARLGVPDRRIRRWIWSGVFPETPYWDGDDPHNCRRRYTLDMLNEAERIARNEGLLTKQRWDLSESLFGDRVSRAWWHTEHNHIDQGVAWCGRKGWPDGKPML